MLTSTWFNWILWDSATPKNLCIRFSRNAGGLLLFIIYTLSHNHILSFLPVGAKFLHPIVASTSLINAQPSSTLSSSISHFPLANASNMNNTMSSSGTSTVTPASQPIQTIDSTIAQDIKSIQARRISSIIGAMSSSSHISSW